MTFSSADHRLLQEMKGRKEFILVLPVFDARGVDRPKLMDDILDHVIRPLISASQLVRFIGTSFTARSFDGLGERLPMILEKDGRDYVLKTGIEPIEGFRRFWYGSESGGERGQVLFFVDVIGTQLRSLFERCADPAVVATKSSRERAFSIARKFAASHPEGAVFCLDSVWLTSMMVFGGDKSISALAEAAIERSKRTIVE